MNFKWFGPLALLAALVIGDQIRINRPGHKYRLTVEVETPEGIKSASGVLAVHPDRGYSRRGQTRTMGDAVFVDLGGGKNLVALLAHVDKTSSSSTTSTMWRCAPTEAAGRKRVSFNEMSRMTGVGAGEGRVDSGARDLRRSEPIPRPRARSRRTMLEAVLGKGLSPPGHHRRSGAERILAARFRRRARRAGDARNRGEIAVAERRGQSGGHRAQGGRIAGRRTRSTPGRPSRENSMAARACGVTC